ncbi:MAG TPA: MBL fold metallo-hydrolase [Vicinamibacteria bacterium]|jgi:beta-lactamase superfamily II metal-dependent hydrolase
MPAPAGSIRIRMYRVGLGDCFLLSLPVDAGHRHLLVDFGAHPFGGDIGTLDDVMLDIEQETGRRLALVVATHEHADHISGFGRFADRFAAFEIGEVWLPWAMDPEKRRAVEARRRIHALAAELREADGLGFSATQALLNATGNEDAVAALRSKFKGAARRTLYFEAGDTPEPLAGLPGLEVKVLSPPTDDEHLRKMEPPGSQRYFRLRNGQRQTVNGLEPFGKRYQVPPAEARRLHGFGKKDEDALRALGAESLDHLAIAIDGVMNNTSLVLLFDFRGQKLLFPGDAQWGNWKSWLDKATSGPLLEQVTFLKVGHHGSYNATPRSALEAMTSPDLAAMVSTQNKPWKSHPDVKLMRRLREKSKRVVQSDSLRRSGAPRGPALPRRMPAGFRRDPHSLWLDYVVRV